MAPPGAPAQAAAPCADAHAHRLRKLQAAYQQPQYQQPRNTHSRRLRRGISTAAVRRLRSALPGGLCHRAGHQDQEQSFLGGCLIVLVSGILVLVSTFMPWFLDATGWDGVTYGEGFAKLFDYRDGYPLFTGLCSLIIRYSSS